MVNEPKSFNDPHIKKNKIKYKQREKNKRQKKIWREKQSAGKF